MDAILPRTLPLLLLCAVTAVAGVGPSSSPSVPVQEPFNLTKKSYNFNTTLYWDYNVTSNTPYFQVEYKTYKMNNWEIVENCGNISRNYCDLSEIIVDLEVYYNVQVKAFVGSESSKYAQTEIYLINDGIIEPPILNASYDEKFVHVDIWYPDVPPVNGKKNVGDYFEDLTYSINYGNELEDAHECDYIACSYKALITHNQTRYCFSAQGRSDSYPMTMEKSKEICIDITKTKGTSNSLYLIIGILVGATGVILLAFMVCIIRRKIEAKSMLPVSLNSISKVLTTQVYLPSDQTTRYDQVSVSPVDSSEEKMTPEEADKVLNVSDDSDIRESIDHGYHSSAGETEQRTDEVQDEKEEPGSSSNNYYRTENSDSSLVCVKVDEDTEQEPLSDIRPLTNTYGYDKPHCLI